MKLPGFTVEGTVVTFFLFIALGGVQLDDLLPVPVYAPPCVIGLLTALIASPDKGNHAAQEHLLHQWQPYTIPCAMIKTTV